MSDLTVYLLYFAFALGGMGVFLLLPQGARGRPLAGAVLGLLALIGLMIALAVRAAAGAGPGAGFYSFSAIAVFGSARVITHPRPVYSALYFVLVVLAVAALLVLQSAEFLAVALIIIYAGAILVTYLFVIMLAHQGGSPVYDRRSREPFLCVLVGFVFMAAVATQAGDAGRVPSPTPAPASAGLEASHGNTFALGAALMTRHVVALELAGLLLLISMIGAIALSRKKTPVEALVTPAPPLGAAGREAAPF